MSKPRADRPDRKPREHGARRRLRPWQKALAVLSVVIALGGAGLMVYAAGTRPQPAPAAVGAESEASNLMRGFAPSGGGTPNASPSSEQVQSERLVDSASGAVFRLGFGFFAGFAVGYAMRMFVRITLLAAGIAILGLAGLHYAGVIDVDWEKISGGFDTFGAWFSEQRRGLAGFITGYLPTFGAGLAGAFVGFRRL